MLSSRSSGGFAFDTAEAVLQVLASIRNSEATTDQKNELRDLVLSYTNGGKDPSVQIQITQKLQSLGVTPVARKESTLPKIIHDFGSARNVPTFHPGVAPVSATPTPTPTPTPAAASVPPAVVATPVPIAPQVQKPIDPTPIPVVQPTPTPVAAATPVDLPSAPVGISVDKQTEGALDRVREIKALVNQQGGNPVNLVDINNEVGREYMSALLNAMKQLNSGVGVIEAMQRLELAYTSVDSVLKDKDMNKPAETILPVQPQPPAPLAASIATPVEVTRTPEPEVQPAPKVPEPPQPPQPQPAAVSASDSRWNSPAVQPKPAPTVVPISNPTPTAAPAPQSSVSPVRSINASSAPLKSIDDLPTAASLKTSATGDPLMTTEVSNGLNQLLSDWMLFKKSGLFGTGPKGIEHPLYAKIKDLQIPLLLAGRFEGATQEIKQSVTDYMNGWRYEQGIIYEQGETFDHYLRRVIRHILDLQK